MDIRRDSVCVFLLHCQMPSSLQIHKNVENLIILHVMMENTVEYGLSRSSNNFNVFTLPQEAVER